MKKKTTRKPKSPKIVALPPPVNNGDTFFVKVCQALNSEQNLSLYTALGVLDHIRHNLIVNMCKQITG